MSLLTITNQSFLAPQGTWKEGKPLLPSHSRIPLSAVLFWFLFRSFLDDAVVVATSTPQPKGRFLTAHRSLVKQSLDIALFIPCSVLSLSLPASHEGRSIDHSCTISQCDILLSIQQYWYCFIDIDLTRLVEPFGRPKAVSWWVVSEWVSKRVSEWVKEWVNECVSEWVS